MADAPDPHCRISKVRLRSNIVLFPGTSRPDLPVAKQPNVAVMAFLARMFERAKRGDMQGIVAVWIDHDGATTHNWAGAQQFPCGLMIGGLHLAAHDLSQVSLEAWAKACEDTDYDPEPA